MPTVQHILSKARRTIFEDPPELDNNRNRGYIAIDLDTRAIIRGMDPVNRVGFVLQKAYFHCKGRFFEPHKFKPAHVKLVASCLGLQRKFDISDYAYTTMKSHQKKILELFNWERFDKSKADALLLHATSLVEKFKVREDILFKLVEWCWAYRVTIPPYSKLVEIVDSAYRDYESDLFDRVNRLVSTSNQKALLAIFNDEILTDEFSTFRKTNQSVSTTTLSENARILSLFNQWRKVCEDDRQKLGLAAETIMYFAEIVYNSTRPQLARLQDGPQKYLYALSFIVHQFYLREDFSIDAFLKELRKVSRQSIGYERERHLERRKKLREEEALVIGSAENASHTLRLILSVSQNTAVGLAERNEKVIQLAKAYLEGKDESLIEAIGRLRENLENVQLKKDRYQFLFESGRSLALKYDQYLPLWIFDEKNSDPKILAAVSYLIKSQTNPSEFPTDFIGQNERDLIFAEDSIPIITKYRAYVFQALEKGIRNKSVTLLFSYRFRPPDATFIPIPKWRSDKDKLKDAAGLSKYNDGPAVLKQLGGSINELFKALNDAIDNGENDFVFKNPIGEWRHHVHRTDYSTEKFIPTLLSTSKQTTLLHIIREIDKYCDFSDAFSNYRIKGGKSAADKKYLHGVLYSIGTNIGHHNLERMANGITEKQLRDTEINYCSIGSLKKVNRWLIEFIHSLNLPLIYADDDRVVHTSSDGKKLVVDVDSLLSNYSFKYYGKDSGVSINNFLDPKQISFFVNVLTSSDREAPHMLDGIMESAKDLWDDYTDGNFPDSVDPDLEHIHSSDTHGYTEAVFSALWFRSILLQPAIAKLWEKKLMAYDAKTVQDNNNKLVRPTQIATHKTILSQWDEMLRVMCSVILGYCPAHLVFRQLAAGVAHFPVYKSFQELGRLVRTKSTLRYLSSPGLRADVRKHLNRVELSQKFGSAIFHGRGGNLQVGTPDEIQRAMLCKTILMNCVIAWNYLFLSDYYNQLTSDEDKQHTAEMIRTGSVMAHAHINMGGSLDFDNEPLSSFRSSLEEMRNVSITF